ncbi:MAG: CSLREA domain-containing protein [Anaerolineae bacterium]
MLTAGLLTPAAPVQAAGTITVNTTVDEFNTGPNCSLREAIQSANTTTNYGGCVLSGTQPFTINLPAGTFGLTRPGTFDDTNAIGDLDILASGTALSGAGASLTIIQQNTSDRVIDFNPTIAPSFSGSLSNLRITGGNGGRHLRRRRHHLRQLQRRRHTDADQRDGGWQHRQPGPRRRHCLRGMRQPDRHQQHHLQQHGQLAGCWSRRQRWHRRRH